MFVARLCLRITGWNSFDFSRCQKALFLKSWHLEMCCRVLIKLLLMLMHWRLVLTYFGLTCSVDDSFIIPLWHSFHHQSIYSKVHLVEMVWLSVWQAQDLVIRGWIPALTRCIYCEKSLVELLLLRVGNRSADNKPSSWDVNTCSWHLLHWCWQTLIESGQ